MKKHGITPPWSSKYGVVSACVGVDGSVSEEEEEEEEEDQDQDDNRSDVGELDINDILDFD